MDHEHNKQTFGIYRRFYKNIVLVEVISSRLIIGFAIWIFIIHIPRKIILHFTLYVSIVILSQFKGILYHSKPSLSRLDPLDRPPPQGHLSIKNTINWPILFYKKLYCQCCQLILTHDIMYDGALNQLLKLILKVPKKKPSVDVSCIQIAYKCHQFLQYFYKLAS